MKRYALGLMASFATLTAAGSADAAAHACARDAKVRAERLLRLHYADGDAPASVQNVGVGQTVRTLPSIKALVGTGRFDVLEVDGYVYRAEYRIRMIYAQIPGECVLIGQEIIERSDPY